MKRRLLRPEYFFDTIYGITPAFIAERDIKGIIFDLDNTVAPYECIVPTEEILAFFAMLKDCGVSFAFISNNSENRLVKFTEGRGWKYIANARKPFPRGVERAAGFLNAGKANILCVGDQLFTDCAAAHLADVDFCLVKPIKDRTDLFFRFKRALEKPLLKKYLSERK